MKTDTEILEEIFKYVNSMKGEVRMYEDDFCAYDYAGTNVNAAWNYGFDDGLTDMANDVLLIIKTGRGE